MKNKVLIIIVVCALILLISVYAVYTYRKNALEVQKITRQYEEYISKKIPASELISLINKTIDYNEQNNIQKNNDGEYIENDENSIKIHIKFKYEDDYKTIEMEQISMGGTESFMKAYSEAYFECTNLQKHNNNRIKELTFIETED